jgi:hypothetical protein
MSTDVLEKLKQLPLEKQQEVDDFIAFLLEKYSLTKEGENEIIEKRIKLKRKAEENVVEKRIRNMGRLKGKIWMADDFNETPDAFKDYM